MMNINPLSLRVVLLCFSFFQFFGCTKNEVNESSPEVFNIVYSKGNAWVNYFYQAEINSNGILEVDENDGLNQQTRSNQYVVISDEIEEIKQLLDDLISIDIAPMYGFDNIDAPTDLLTTYFVFSTPEKSDSSSFYFIPNDALPKELGDVLTYIESLIQQKDTLLNQ